jgi:hypothetical protein
MLAPLSRSNEGASNLKIFVSRIAKIRRCLRLLSRFLCFHSLLPLLLCDSSRIKRGCVCGSR